MKYNQFLAILPIAFGSALFAETPVEEPAQADHNPAAHQQAELVPAPNHGRVITSTEPHVEFFVTPERFIRLTFLSPDNKPLDPEGRTASAIGGDRSSPTRMTFTADNMSLVSDLPLPEGNKIPIILQIIPAPEADNVTEKFTVNLTECPTCSHKEYACICEH